MLKRLESMVGTIWCMLLHNFYPNQNNSCIGMRKALMIAMDVHSSGFSSPLSLYLGSWTKYKYTKKGSMKMNMPARGRGMTGQGAARASGRWQERRREGLEPDVQECRYEVNVGIECVNTIGSWKLSAKEHTRTLLVGSHMDTAGT